MDVWFKIIFFLIKNFFEKRTAKKGEKFFFHLYDDLSNLNLLNEYKLLKDLNSIQNKRKSFELSDGVESYLNEVNKTFECTSKGYFADINNNCKLFHICVPFEFPDGRKEMAQYTFACSNQTVFNQFSMTCTYKTESMPCKSSSDFFYLNERIGKEKTLLHEKQDYNKAVSFTSIKP